MSKIQGRIIKIDEPFIVHGTVEEFETGKLSIIVDDKKQTLQVTWETDIRTNVKYYPYV